MLVVCQLSPPTVTVTEPQSQTPDVEVTELQHGVPVPMYSQTEAVETVVSEQVSD